MHLEVIDSRVLSVLIRKHGKQAEMGHTLTQLGHTEVYTYFKAPCCGPKI